MLISWNNNNNNNTNKFSSLYFYNVYTLADDMQCLYCILLTIVNTCTLME